MSQIMTKVETGTNVRIGGTLDESKVSEESDEAAYDEKKIRQFVADCLEVVDDNIKRKS